MQTGELVYGAILLSRSVISGALVMLVVGPTSEKTRLGRACSSWRRRVVAPYLAPDALGALLSLTISLAGLFAPVVLTWPIRELLGVESMPHQFAVACLCASGAGLLLARRL